MKKLFSTLSIKRFVVLLVITVTVALFSGMGVANAAYHTGTSSSYTWTTSGYTYVNKSYISSSAANSLYGTIAGDTYLSRNHASTSAGESAVRAYLVTMDEATGDFTAVCGMSDWYRNPSYLGPSTGFSTRAGFYWTAVGKEFVCWGTSRVYDLTYHSYIHMNTYNTPIIPVEY